MLIDKILGFMHFLRESLSFISTVGLAGLGIWASTPQGANRIQQRGRRRLAMAFFILTVAALAGEIDNRQNNRALRANIESLSTKSDIQRTLNILTGGTSYPFITAESEGKILYFYIHNMGEYPLYDVAVELIASDLREEMLVRQASDPKAVKVDRNSGKLYFEMGTIAARDSKRLTGWWLGGAYPKHIKFGFKARNGPFSQSMALLNCPEKCTASSRLKGPKDELLKEVGDPIDWDSLTFDE